MPPWYADAESTQFKGSQALSAKEIDVLMTWAAGGTPEGIADAVHPSNPPPILPILPMKWPLGPTDAVMDMLAPVTLQPGEAQMDREFVWPADGIADKWIRAVDVLPGTRSIVRSASIALRTAAGEQVVGLWLPGEVPEPLAGDGAFRVPPRASLVLRVHYQRRIDRVADAVTDRSQLGIYMTSAPHPRTVRELEIRGDGDFPFDVTRTFTQRVDRTVRVAALRPVSGPMDATVALTAVPPGGYRTPIPRLQLRPGCLPRYRFAPPTVLPTSTPPPPPPTSPP